MPKSVKTNETYIAYGVVRPHLYYIRFTDAMPQDLNKLLDKIKASAVERCRDRLDTAASKAHGLISTQNGENYKKILPQTEIHGVTSVLKRRHGL